MRILTLLLVLLMVGCAPVQMRGVNLLQSSQVPLDDLQNVENMQNLKILGANTVAFIPFINQDTETGCNLSIDENYSQARLKKTIELAHQAGLHVVLKPQILIPGSWAGMVKSDNESGWACWFSAYSDNLIPLAQLAQDTHTEMLVIGTELHHTETRPEWRKLVDQIRMIYHNKISYVAHDVHDLEFFTALDKVDSVGITYYPPLEKEALRTQMKLLVSQLKTDVIKLNKPFWIAEIGITSRTGALENPWLWPEQLGKDIIPDPALQANVLDSWLTEMKGDWHTGILIWAWYSDKNAGGLSDTDFTIQNKPATDVVSCHWLGRCH